MDADIEALIRRMPWVCAKHGRRFPTKPAYGICPDCEPGLTRSRLHVDKRVWGQSVLLEEDAPLEEDEEAMTGTGGTGSWSGERRSFPARTRDIILRRDPVCRWDEDGVTCTAASTEADHVIPDAEGGTDDVSNGQGLCSFHHSIKTAREQARGRARRSATRAPRRHPGLLPDH